MPIRFLLIIFAAAMAQAISATDTYSASVSYRVWLPTSDEPVEYTVRLLQQPAAEGDTLAPCNYLIDWQARTPSGALTEGFNAYFSGNHYRYRDGRLQEYHSESDPRPLSGRGVQLTAQFADLLPAFINRRLAELSADSTCTLTRSEASRRVTATETVRGYTARETTYTFSPDGLPLSIAIESSPGSISEQSVEADYTDIEPWVTAALDENVLISLYPEIFEKYRQADFRLENLPGRPIPSFALPTADGRRITRNADTHLSSPEIYAFLDPGAANCLATIAAVREAVGSLPLTMTVNWVVATNNREEALSAIAPAMGENLIVSAGSLARDCGVRVFPSLIMVDTDGIVRDFIIGYNSELASIVLEKTALLR